MAAGYLGNRVGDAFAAILCPQCVLALEVFGLEVTSVVTKSKARAGRAACTSMRLSHRP